MASSQSSASANHTPPFVLLDTRDPSINLMISNENRIYVFEGGIYRTFPNSPGLLKYHSGKKVSTKEPLRGKRHNCVCARTGYPLVCFGSLRELQLDPSAPSRTNKTSQEAVLNGILSLPNKSDVTQSQQESPTIKNTPGRGKPQKPLNTEMQQAFENVLAQRNAGLDPHIKGALVRWILGISPATLARYQKKGQVPKPKKIPGAKTNYWLLSEILNLKKE